MESEGAGLLRVKPKVQKSVSSLMWSGSGKHHTTKDRERSFRGGETAAAAEAAVEAAVALEEASAVSSRAASFSRAGSFSHGTDRRPTSPRSSAGTPRLAASPRAFSSGSDSSPRAAAAAATPRASALRAAREPTAKELKAQAKDLRGKAEELEQRAQLVAEREASMERALAAERARLEAAGREPQEPWVAFAQFWQQTWDKVLTAFMPPPPPAAATPTRGSSLAPIRAYTRKNVPLPRSQAEAEEEAEEEQRANSVKGARAHGEAHAPPRAHELSRMVDSPSARHTPLADNREIGFTGRKKLSTFHSSKLAGQVAPSTVSMHEAAVAAAKLEGRQPPTPPGARADPGSLATAGMRAGPKLVRTSSVVPQPGGIHKAMIRP